MELGAPAQGSAGCKNARLTIECPLSASSWERSPRFGVPRQLASEGKTVHIVCIGGGPAGLYFGLLMKKLNPAHGCRSSSATSPTTRSAGAWCSPTPRWTTCASGTRRPRRKSRRPSTIGTTSRCSSRASACAPRGHGFVGIGRKKLLNILQARCEALGVELSSSARSTPTRSSPTPISSSPRDGVNSKIRNKYAAAFKPDMMVRPNRFIWLGTNKSYDAFTFDFRRTRARLVSGAHLQVRRQDLDLHRRDHRGDV